MTVRTPRWRRGFNLTLLLSATPLILAVVLGCSSKPPLNSPPEHIVAKPWANVGESLPSHDGDSDAVVGLSQVLAGTPPTLTPGRPLNVLVMSGGGKYGAFTAGVLAGWTKSGTRPTFDIATGISSGAVTAALAFIGPKRDHQLEVSFTTLRRSDLFTWQPIRGLLNGSGLMTSAPLEQTLARQVDEEFMCELREAHMAGRRLYIGTGNLLTNRFAVWDLGAIACSGRADATVLIRKILLASCSVPGVVKPVEISVEVNGVRYTELHGDAGNFAQAFVRSPGTIPAGSNFWVLSAGKVYRDQLQKKPTVFGLLGAGISNSLYTLFRADLMKLFALCAVTQSHFNLMVMPQDFHGETSSAAFDPAELTRMFWLGYQMAAGSGQWLTTPPDTLPGEADPPRTGLEFLTPK